MFRNGGEGLQFHFGNPGAASTKKRPGRGDRVCADFSRLCDPKAMLTKRGDGLTELVQPERRIYTFVPGRSLLEHS